MATRKWEPKKSKKEDKESKDKKDKSKDKKENKKTKEIDVVKETESFEKLIPDLKEAAKKEAEKEASKEIKKLKEDSEGFKILSVVLVIILLVVCLFTGYQFFKLKNREWVSGKVVKDINNNYIVYNKNKTIYAMNNSDWFFSKDSLDCLYLDDTLTSLDTCQVEVVGIVPTIVSDTTKWYYSIYKHLGYNIISIKDD